MPVLSSLLGYAEIVDWRLVAMVAITWCQIMFRGCQSVDLCVCVSLSFCVCRDTTVLLQVTNCFHYYSSFYGTEAKRACHISCFYPQVDWLSFWLITLLVHVMFALQYVSTAQQTSYTVARMHLLQTAVCLLSTVLYRNKSISKCTAMDNLMQFNVSNQLQ